MTTTAKNITSFQKVQSRNDRNFHSKACVHLRPSLYSSHRWWCFWEHESSRYTPLVSENTSPRDILISFLKKTHPTYSFCLDRIIFNEVLFCCILHIAQNNPLKKANPREVIEPSHFSYPDRVESSTTGRRMRETTDSIPLSWILFRK